MGGLSQASGNIYTYFLPNFSSISLFDPEEMSYICIDSLALMILTCTLTRYIWDNKFG